MKIPGSMIRGAARVACASLLLLGAWVLMLAAATGERTAGRYSALAPHFNQSPGGAFSKATLSHARFVDLLRAKTKLPEAWYRAGERESVYDNSGAQEALEYGVVDRIRDHHARSSPTHKAQPE